MARMRQQISLVLSQRFWFKVGDIDDCWVLSALQLVFAVMPWIHLPSTKVFREAAGDPDDGEADGGEQQEIMRGIRTLWPEIRKYLHRVDHGDWRGLVTTLEQGHPVSLAVDSAHLPDPRGFTGPHRITAVETPNGKKWIGNPLGPAYDRWDELAAWEDIREAVMRYGQMTSRKSRGAWYIAGPTAEEAFPHHPLFGPMVADAVAVECADLAAENRELRTALTACSSTSAAAVEAARANAEAAAKFVAMFGG